MKNKKTLSITALVIGLFAISMPAAQSEETPEIVICEASKCSTSVICDLANGFDLFLTQPIGLVSEVGFFEERIDRGLFTHSDALFVKAKGTVGTVYGKNLVTSLEFADGQGDSFFGGFVGLEDENKYVGARLGTNYADGDLSGDTDLELNFGIGGLPLPFLKGVYGGVDCALVSGGGYDVSLNLNRDIGTFFNVDVTALGEVGKTWGYSDNYEYVLGALRGSYNLYGGTLYGQVSTVDNEVQTDGFESVFQVGYTLSF